MTAHEPRSSAAPPRTSSARACRSNGPRSCPARRSRTRRCWSGRSSQPVPRRLDLRRPRRPGPRARRLPDGRDRRRERARRRRRRRPPARVPATPAATAARASSTRPRARVRAPAVPVPRVDLRLRRRAARTRRSPTGSRTSTRLLRPARRCASRSSRGSCCSTSPARRRRPQEHVGDLAPHLAALPAAPSCGAARGSSTTSTPTGRRSPRTTASACTARACTRSSTGSRTTCRGETITGAGAWCGGSMTLAEGVETMATRRRRTAAGRSRASTSDLRSILYFLAVPQHARLAAPRLRDAAHAVAARRRTAPRSSASGSSSRATIAARGLRPVRRGRVLGPGQPRGLAASASSRSAGMASRALHARPLHDAGGRRARVRRDGRRALPGGARRQEVAP